MGEMIQPCLTPDWTANQSVSPETCLLLSQGRIQFLVNSVQDYSTEDFTRDWEWCCASPVVAVPKVTFLCQFYNKPFGQSLGIFSSCQMLLKRQCSTSVGVTISILRSSAWIPCICARCPACFHDLYCFRNFIFGWCICEDMKLFFLCCSWKFSLGLWSIWHRLKVLYPTWFLFPFSCDYFPTPVLQWVWLLCSD